MGKVITIQNKDGSVTKTWQAEPVKDENGKIVWDPATRKPIMDTAPEGVLD